MPGSAVEKRPDHLPVPVPGAPARRLKSEAGAVGAFRSLHRNRHLTVPLAVPPVTWSAAEIMHAYGLGTDAALPGAVLSLAVFFFAPHKWDRPAEQWYARLSVAALWLWLWAAATFGADAGTPGEVLGALLVVLSVAWGIPWYRHYRPRDRRKRERVLRQWSGWWDLNSTSHFTLSGSRVTAATDDGVTVRLDLQLWAGRQTIADLRAAVPRIESALQGFAPPGGVRPQEHKGDASKATLFIKRVNPLAEPVQWNGPLAPKSVLDPWCPGKTETGRWRQVRPSE